MNSLNFEPSLIKKTYQFYLQSHWVLNKFPKKYRYSLAVKIENNLLEIIELIFLANVNIKNLREPIIHRASAKCDLLRIFLRLASDLNLINAHQYLNLQNQLSEIGKMIGGWLKFLRTQ